MNYKFKVKKLGNNWYLDIEHLNSCDIKFNEKICKIFNLLDKNYNGILEINLYETYSILGDNTIFIEDSDLLRYFTTVDSFDIRFYINDYEYSISSEMYGLIEFYYNTNFHKTIYRIEIFNGTV